VSAPRRLELLHWNDLHGRFDGLARLSHRARTIRDEADHPVLVLDGGDVEETSVRLSAMTLGVAGWRLLGAAGVDAAVAGNGGLLRYGPDRLPDYAAALGSAPLVCDLERDGATPAGAEPSRLVEVGGLRVGIIGITDYYPQYDEFGLVERGRVTAVRREAAALRQSGAEVVVVLSHAGLNHDRGLSWAVRGVVDVIVGGHTHHALRGGDLDQGVPIAQAGWQGEHLGRVVLEVGEDGVRVVDMTLEAVAADAAADPRVVEEIAAAERDLDEWLAEVVAHLPEAAPLGDPVNPAARLMVEALLGRQPGDLGLLIPMHLDAGLPAGPVTRRQVWEATSSPGNLAWASLTGAEVRDMVLRGRAPEYAAYSSRVSRGRPFGRLQLVGLDGVDGVDSVDSLDDTRTYRVTGSDLEFSIYGGLLDARPESYRTEVPEILPEILESHLRKHYPATASSGTHRDARRGGSRGPR
jgi:2',3'-cyclic-nucleotide 2'-phosphodiesterase (5'-nucleotidase family)